MKIKSKANEGATKVIPKFGLARHRQILAESWKSERHEERPGTARLKVSGGQSRGKRAR